MKEKKTFVLLIAVVGLVLAGSTFVGFQLYKGTLQEEKQSDIRTSTDYLRSELDLRMRGLRQTVELWAQNPAVTRHGTDAQREALAQLRNRTAFSGVSVISANGTMTNIDAGLSPARRAALIGSDFDDRVYVQRALQGHTYTSQPVDAESGNYIVTVSTPIVRDGEVVGVLSGAFHLSEGAFFEKFESSLAPAQGLTIRSRSGTTLYASEPTPSTDQLDASATLQTTGWTVSVQESRQIVQSTVAVVTYLQFGSLFAVLLSLGTFGWWVYRRNLKQLEQLLHGFERLRRRNYGTRVEFDGGDGWDRIERGFNEASRELAQYEAERDEREQTLREFRQAVEAAGHAIFITDSDGTIEYVNPAFERITGYDSETAIGETPRILNSGEMSGQYFENLWTTIEAGDVWDAEIVNSRRNGDLYHAHQTIAPILGDDEDIEGFVSIQTDITDRKEQEEELRVNRRAIDEAPVGIAITDATQPDNPLTYVNSGFVELTGYSRMEALGRNCRFLQGANTDSEPVQLMRERIDARDPVSVELRNYRKDGTEFWNRLTIAPVEDETGEVTHFIGFLEDVTDRKEREQHLAVLDRVLRHNLRNEMSVIRGRAETIAAEAESEQAASAEQIVQQSDRLLATAEKQRAITEVLTGTLTTRVVDVASFLQQIATTVSDTHPEAVIAVECPADVTLSVIPELGQAIEELVTNGIVHSDREMARVDVDVSVDSDTVRIDIADDGPGIPDMELEVLTGEAEPSALYHGSGLGLWLANWIVSRLDGTLEFGSNDPRGTVVSVVIPRDPREVESSTSIRSETTDPG